MANLTASGSTPAVIFDVDATSNDWRMITDASTMTLERYSGSWSSRFAWSSSGGLTVYGNGASSLTFDAPSDDDFQLSNDGAGQFFLKVNTGSGYTEVCQWNENLSTYKVSIKIASGAPALTFEDTTTDAVSFRVRCDDDIFYIENNESGSFVAGGLEIGSAKSYVHATRGLISGHDAAGGTSHAICWKKFTGNLSAGDISNGYFTRTVTDNSPPEWKACVIGVIVMLADDDSNTCTFQVCDWRSSSASGALSVQVVYRDGTNQGDMARVAFDSTYYEEDDQWKMLVFYDPLDD